MRVILDGVFNHVSSRHPFFQDVLARGRQSRYYRWFYGLPEHPRLPAEGEAARIRVLFLCGDMPKTDLSCPEACAYFCEVGRYWIETFDIDGWRLDVANEINDGFLRAFRAAVKAAKPDALLIGEVWEDASHFLQGDMLDSCMNYDFGGWPCSSSPGAPLMRAGWPWGCTGCSPATGSPPCSPSSICWTATT